MSQSHKYFLTNYLINIFLHKLSCKYTLNRCDESHIAIHCYFIHLENLKQVKSLREICFCFIEAWCEESQLKQVEVFFCSIEAWNTWNRCEEAQLRVSWYLFLFNRSLKHLKQMWGVSRGDLLLFYRSLHQHSSAEQATHCEVLKFYLCTQLKPIQGLEKLTLEAGMLHGMSSCHSTLHQPFSHAAQGTKNWMWRSLQSSKVFF